MASREVENALWGNTRNDTRQTPHSEYLNLTFKVNIQLLLRESDSTNVARNH